MNVIFIANRGDYLTGLKLQSNGKAEIREGSIEDAIHYTDAEAVGVIKSLTEANGEGYHAELIS